MASTGFNYLFDIFSSDIFSKNKVSIEDGDINILLSKIESSLVSGDVHAVYARKLTNQVKANLKKAAESSTTMKNRIDTLTVKHKTQIVKSLIINELIKLLSPLAAKSDNSEEDKKSNWEPVKRQSKDSKPAVVLFVGLIGNGKTTTLMKYAHYYKSRGLQVACVCGDTFRAGAFDQLKQNCGKIKVPFYGSYIEQSAAKVVSDGINIFSLAAPASYSNSSSSSASTAKYNSSADKYNSSAGAASAATDVILVDTAGRFSQSQELTSELEDIIKVTNPDYTLMVIDGSIGQSVKEQAIYFSKFNVDGIILTKMDNQNIKGGGAIAAIAATNAPVKYLGTGESFEDLEKFDPKSYVSRLLGFGDVKMLLNKFQVASSESKAPKMFDKISNPILSSTKFTFEDFVEQVKFLLKLTNGKISSISSLIPGFQKIFSISNKNSSEGKKKKDNPDQMDQEFEKRLKGAVIICDSMTVKELNEDDKFLSSGRISRISRGSGKSEQDVRDVIKLFLPMKELLNSVKKLPKNIQTAFSQGQLSSNTTDVDDGDGMTEEDMMKTAMKMLPKGFGRNSQAMSKIKSLMKNAF
jgi:signal recognition particle subunit SRP54